MTADVSYNDFVINPEQVIYLNDDNFKSCVTPAFVKKNGLTHDDNSWFPLTETEFTFLSNHVPAYMGRFRGDLSYSAFYDGKKWLCVSFNTKLNNSKNHNAHATELNYLFRDMLLFAAKAMNGKLAFDYKPCAKNAINPSCYSTIYNVSLLVPFEYAQSVADDFFSWLDHLNAMLHQAMMSYHAAKNPSAGQEVSDWIIEHGYCAFRHIVGTDPDDVATRVAYIEKTPRVRVRAFDGNTPTCLLESSHNWLYGFESSSGEDGYGFFVPAREWCDEQLRLLGFVLTSNR